MTLHAEGPETAEFDSLVALMKRVAPDINALPSEVQGLALDHVLRAHASEFAARREHARTHHGTPLVHAEHHPEPAPGHHAGHPHHSSTDTT